MYRVGIGHDRHRFGPGEAVRLGGVDVPFSESLLGHSDADVLLHAVTDALLGAAALGDIGEIFPDTDEANRGRDSAEMLQIAWRRVEETGWSLVNLDCTIFAQRPKLAPHKRQIRESLAEILKIDPAQVGLKAKTGESVGTIGRGECIDVHCVVLLERLAAESPAP